MKKVDTILKEFVARSSTDNLRYMSVRFDNRIAGDLSEALDILSECQDVDKWLKSAESNDDFYDMLDLIQEYVDRELGKRAPELVQN